MKEGIPMVTKIDHIELVVHRFDEYVALFRALGFRELTRTKHHGDSIELQLPGENQPIFEIHRVSGEENIGVNHIAFQVPDVQAAQRELATRGIAAGLEPRFVPSTGRTNLNFRDPDGWRLQLVDATRGHPGSAGNTLRASPRPGPQLVLRRLSWPADRDHAGTLQSEVIIRAPHLGDPERTQEDQTGGVDVCQFPAPQTLESIHDGGVMPLIEAEEFEMRQLGQGQTKRARGILAQAVEEPPVRFGDHREGRVPPTRRVGEEAKRCGVIAIRPVEEGDQDAAVEKGRPSPHGRPRP